MRRQPDEVLAYLKTLQEGHDASNELLAIFDAQEEQHTKLMVSTREYQKQKVIAKQALRASQEEAMNLQIQVNQLQEDLQAERDVRILDSASDTLGGTGGGQGGGGPGKRESLTPTDSTNRFFGYKKSPRHPNPKKFTGDTKTGPSFRDWIFNILD